MTETDRKCPNCGGTMEFDPVTGGLRCPFCDHTEEIPAAVSENETEEPKTNEDGTLKEIDFRSLEETASTDWGTDTKTVRCKTCGAESIYDVNAIANCCPYCGSVQVMEAGDQSNKIMAPHGVVTFEISKEQAAKEFRRWIDGKLFCPGAAKRSAKPDHIQGLYVPYWTFDAEGSGSYTGRYGIHREEKDKDGNTVTKTDWHNTSGFVRKSFDDVLVPGSEQYNKGHLRGIEPFYTEKAKVYKPEYLSGFVAERYSVKVTDAWPAAEKDMRSQLTDIAESDIRSKHRCDEVSDVRVNAEFDAVTFKYLLLPIWISSFMFGGKTYNFMVNGQTGEVSGTSPISWIKVLFAVLIACLIIWILYQFLG